MSRKSKSRRRARKARRHAQRAEDAWYRERGMLPLRYQSQSTERRDGRRWASLSARGGLRIGFRATGVRVPVDFDDPEAEGALTEALAQLNQEPGEG